VENRNMKKLLLILTALISCNVFANTLILQKTLLPTDDPIIFEHMYNKDDVVCYFQTGGDNIPINVSPFNFKMNPKEAAYSAKPGDHVIKYPGATALYFGALPINPEVPMRYIISNNDFSPSSLTHSLLVVTCWSHPYS